MGPLKLIRFGALNSYRIGHFAGNIEMYMCEREHGFQPNNTIDIFYIQSKYNFYVSNLQLLKMWKRKLYINQIGYYLSIIDRRFYPEGTIHNIRTLDQDKDIYGLRDKSKIFITFTNKENSIGKTSLKKMGIINYDNFICLANRDQSYLNKTFNNKDWSYRKFENTDIKKCSQAVEWLIKQGNYVIRMGKIVSEALENNSKKYIEYAQSTLRNDLLDIYLPAHCKFYITSPSGINAIPVLFKKPILYNNFNYLNYAHLVPEKSLIIYRKFWLINEQRFMNFREMHEWGKKSKHLSNEFKTDSIELIENTQEEILDATKEMYDRLSGAWQSTEEDDELQRRYWSIFDIDIFNGESRPKIGASFLRENRELLD